MAGWMMPDMRPWGRRPLTIPPNSASAWIQLAIWELWMGMMVSVVLGLGLVLMVSAPDRVATTLDLSNCYAPAPVSPCERLVYRGGALFAAFSVLCGFTLVIVAAWLLWELWSAVEPRPITDDFLRLLYDSFGHDWRNPLKWPWARVLWAYGFTALGAMLAAGVALMIWTTLASSRFTTPTINIDTSQSFRLER